MILATIEHNLSLTLAVALMAGVFAQVAARHLRLPGIVVLLAAGAALGPQALGWVDPRSLGDALFVFVEFGVAVILFEGGLNLDVRRLRREESSIRRLVTLGALVTFVGAAAAAQIFPDWDWQQAVLFGSLVVVTGPTVVSPLVRDMRLRPRVRTILEAEGVLIDPIGVILAVLVLQFVLSPRRDTIAMEAGYVLLRLGFGAAIGIAGGWFIGYVTHRRRLLPEGLVNIFSLGWVIFLFEISNLVVPHSGIVSVTVCGIAAGNLGTPIDREVREFKDQLTVLLIGLLFILLAADMDLNDLRALGWRGPAVVGLLVFVVRPLGVWFSTRQANLPLPERLFIAWIAPRGIVAAAVASLTAVDMERESIEGGEALRAMVFLTIAATVVLAGLTARPVAALLGLRLPGRDRVAILGASGLALAIGRLLRDAGRHVVVIDTDRNRCRAAHDEGLAVVRGDGLKEQTWLGANMELVGTVIGLTPNSHLNSIFVRQTREMHHVPHGFVAVDSAEGDEAPEHVQRQEGQGLFAGPHDVERWDVRCRNGDVAVERMSYVSPGDVDPRREAHELYVMLTVERGSRVEPVSFGFEPGEGDVVSVAIHAPQREEALDVLAHRGWTVVPEAEGDEARESTSA
ncbi:MAG: sodium:proton antiporter [Phycisphaeraceae bacterium]|nr:sodium:proton antiporter [Phycisphaeraceae bacterium]